MWAYQTTRPVRPCRLVLEGAKASANPYASAHPPSFDHCADRPVHEWGLPAAAHESIQEPSDPHSLHVLVNSTRGAQKRREIQTNPSIARVLSFVNKRYE